jgi:4-carboxymuconolactone decarboxylase
MTNSEDFRLPLLAERDGLSETQLAVFDWIVESRGTMIRPYEVMLHVPEMARPAAELGHEIRYEGGLSDHDREVAILATAVAHACAFEWDTHVGLARGVGVDEATIDALRGADSVDPPDDVIVGFVREMCAGSSVSDATFAAVQDQLGTSGLVELTMLVGYYTMLAFAINLAEPEDRAWS